MIYEGLHEAPQHIDCSEVVRVGGRVKAGIVAKNELEDGEEIRVSIRSSRYPSVEIFTIRNIKPGNYRLVLAVIPRSQENETKLSTDN